MAPESWVAFGATFTGLGMVVGGIAGIRLPAADRSGALFALIAGVGVGVIVLGFGVLVRGYEESMFVFFVAGFLGLVMVCVGVWLAPRPSHRS